MTKILLIVVKEKIRGRDVLITSHGINLDTDEVVILPQVDPILLGAKIDSDLNEYVLVEGEPDELSASI